MSCCHRRAAEGIQSALRAVGHEVSPRGRWLLGMKVAMPHWGCRGESQPSIELRDHHAVTAPLWTSPKDPCHHRHLWAVPLLMGLCHGTAIGMVIGHCSASNGTGHAGVGLGDSPRLGLFWWIQAFHAFVIFVSVHFHIRNP